MANVVINDAHLFAIGDALRDKLGETRKEVQETYKEVNHKVSKTPNVNTPDDYEKGYKNGMNTVDTVTIDGAASIKILITYETEGKDWDYVRVQTNSRNIKYGGTLGTDTITDSGNTVTFTFVSDTSNDGYLGYYAEVYGYDSAGNEITWNDTVIDEAEVPNTYKPREMAEAVQEASKVVITGDMVQRFDSQTHWIKFYNTNKKNIVFEDVYNFYSMFNSNTELETMDHDLTDSTGRGTGYRMFFKCSNLREVNGVIDLGGAYNLNNMFAQCNKLRYLPEVRFTNLGLTEDQSGSQFTGFFDKCYSLRSINPEFLKKLKGKYIPYTSSPIYSQGFRDCHTLDEIIDIPVNGNCNNSITSNLTTNYFSDTFTRCFRAKEVMFEMDSYGNPLVVNWSNQTINLSGIGYVNSGYTVADITTKYNSGITADKEVTDGGYNGTNGTYVAYEALKDDPDWFTLDRNFSRYNLDSAYNTIRSLPNTSDWIATNGGTNTIIFEGLSGLHTTAELNGLPHQGAINNLVEGQIAVATDKGWTVSFV